ncbi:MAG: terminase large subunit domain-containing protein [Tepidisphaeraceae bacterium]
MVVNWHRQKGKDFTAAAKAVDDAIRTGQSWFIVALTQAQADETFNKCKKVVEVFKELLKLEGRVEEEAEDFIDRDKEIDQAFECTARILKFPNGARVVSLPGKNPDTLAGRTGNLILTEFGLYPKGGYEHWETLFPITTRGGFKMIIISTPRGRNTKFYEIFQNPDGFYSIHLCDIRKSVFEDGYQLYDAKGKPFPQGTDEEKEHAIATFRKIYNSESKWPREYECKFTGDLSSLITWAELERGASLQNTDGFVYRRFDGLSDVSPDTRVALNAFVGVLGRRRIEIGWDVARRNHISAVAINLAEPNKPKHLLGVIAMRDCSFEFMRTVVMALMDTSYSAVGAGDATGLGMESNETLKKRYRDRWIPFTFNASSKREVASALKTGFSDGMQTLPAMDGPHKFIATDIYAIQKDDTGANDVYEETENPLLPESHCDIAYAVGLARVAGARATKKPLPPPRRQKPKGW